MKRIIVLSDGTGNSAAKLFKTNVWRLYQALDLTGPAGGIRQVARYNDGVGTSSFKPLAVVGGAFGYGLKRNVLELYEFLCRNWQPGDEIYAFGFSRGAFTIRMLVELVLAEGLLTTYSDVKLAHYSRDAYRQYRLRYEPRHVTGKSLVESTRWLRSHYLSLYRGAHSQHRHYHDIDRVRVPTIKFVGLWDTVGAYGTPLAELTRGIDDWIWPISLPNNVLSPRVEIARHALALDDERDTFHPILWDELAERGMVDCWEVSENRLQQVWFSGMHADVGGGYPDDSLSYPPLLWMVKEAQAAGLCFRPRALELLELGESGSAPLHDSRRGLGGYYRYQPRKIAARMLPSSGPLPADPNSLIMQDPDPRARSLLTAAKVHQSVFDRIKSGPGRYAPLVLPERYEVVGGTPGTPAPETPEQADRRRRDQDSIVWNVVWRKRVNYFQCVAISLFLAAAPAWSLVVPASACEGPFCLLSPLFQGLARFLPAFAEYWLEPFSHFPFIALLAIVALAASLLRGEALQRRIRGHMHELWAPVHLNRDAGALARGHGDRLFEWLRTRPLYQRTLQSLKWTYLPGAFGVSMFASICAIILLPVGLVTARTVLSFAERDGSLCNVEGAMGTVESWDGKRLFSTDAMCWDTGATVRAGEMYTVRLQVVKPWLTHNGMTPASPEGIEASRMPHLSGFAFIPFRRSLSGGWHQPFVTIVQGEARATQGLSFHASGSSYEATFEPVASGHVYLWVNDSVVGWTGLTSWSYQNNKGTALVRFDGASTVAAQAPP